jgi:hypothetical protein
MSDGMISCGDHGPQRGYIVCKHIAYENAPVAHHIAAGDDLGEVLCLICSLGEPRVNDVLLVCESCVQTKILRRDAS